MVYYDLLILLPASGGPDNQMIISEIGMGSVAHRSGTLIPGDRILSVNNHSLQDCSLQQASQILHSSADVVTLVVQKESGGICDEFQRLGSPSSSRCDRQRDLDLISPASTGKEPDLIARLAVKLGIMSKSGFFR